MSIGDGKSFNPSGFQYSHMNFYVTNARYCFPTDSSDSIKVEIVVDFRKQESIQEVSLYYYFIIFFNPLFLKKKKKKPPAPDSTSSSPVDTQAVSYSASTFRRGAPAPARREALLRMLQTAIKTAQRMRKSKNTVNPDTESEFRARV